MLNLGIQHLPFNIMHYSTFSPDQYDLFARYDSEAFGESFEELRKWLEDDKEVYLRGLFDGNEPVAQLCFYRFEMSDGRGSLPCAAIGAVSCRPAKRRRGYVAQLMRHLCDELRESGIPLSALNPFKMSFYRQFGWATFVEQRGVRAGLEAFEAFRKPIAGRFEPAGKEQIDVLHDIYLKALRGRFGPIVRTPHRWEGNTLHSSRATRYAYIWHDDAEQARAYCIYSIEKRDNKQTMVCREAVALDPQARAQLFSFMASQDSQVEQVEFQAPAEAPLSAILGGSLEFLVRPSTMLRLVDCKAALEDYHYPSSCTGRITLAITDSWIGTNQGSYALELQDGKASVERLPADTQADVSCDIAVLAQLYSRLVRPRMAATFGLIEVHNQSALKLLDAMFDGLAPFISDYF